MNENVADMYRRICISNAWKGMNRKGMYKNKKGNRK